jgi:hypothetical protein
MSGPAVDLTRRQALAFRLARHHLAARAPPDEDAAKAVISATDELAAEAERIAPFRGAETGGLRTATL